MDCCLGSPCRMGWRKENGDSGAAFLENLEVKEGASGNIKNLKKLQK